MLRLAVLRVACFMFANGLKDEATIDCVRRGGCALFNSVVLSWVVPPVVVS